MKWLPGSFDLCFSLALLEGVGFLLNKMILVWSYFTDDAMFPAPYKFVTNAGRGMFLNTYQEKSTERTGE